MENHSERGLWTRRDVLRMGAACAWTLAGEGRPSACTRSVILLWMNGGPAGADTFAAEPAEGSVRGMRLVETAAEGVVFPVELRRMAEEAGWLRIYWRVVSPECCHARGWHLWHTGQRLPLSACPPPRPRGLWAALKRRWPEAFDLRRETGASIRAYGESRFGRDCLIARRLVERGVRHVEVELDGWDIHCDLVPRTQRLLRILDPAFAALLQDLRARGLLETTLVVWAGEFGRTADVNALGGRDHDPRRGCVVMAGGGTAPGVVRASVPLEVILSVVYSGQASRRWDWRIGGGVWNAHQSG